MICDGAKAVRHATLELKFQMSLFKIMAAQWILEFVRLSGNKMYPHISGILMAQLPNLVFDDERRRTMTEIQYKRE